MAECIFTYLGYPSYKMLLIEVSKKKSASILK